MRSINCGILAVDASDRVIFINESAERILNADSRKVMGHPSSKIFPDLLLKEVIGTGEAKSIDRVHVNGKVLHAELTPIYKEKGRLLGAVATFQLTANQGNIPGEPAAAKQLIAEYDALIASSFDGIIFNDGYGRIVRINDTYKRISGLDPKQLIGRTIRELLDEGIIMDNCASFRELKKGKPVTVVQKLSTGKTMLITSTPIFDEKGKRITLVISNSRDLTALNMLKDELEKTTIQKQRYFEEVSRLRAEKLADTEVISKSQAMRRVIEFAVKVAAVDSNVLITGESGVGKEVIARLIHKTSPRRKGPFININCGAIPDTLIESELFGYAGGAFTGARAEGKPGVFEMADGGTLLMDEVGELSGRMAVGLLRVLQEKKVTRVGGTKAVLVDARIIAATNADLKALVRDGTFRSDLYYRLNVVNIYIPPLRERPEDIPVLCAKVMESLNKQYHRNNRLDVSAMDLLMTYDWPGNVRELKNMLERLVILATGDLITAEMLPIELRNGKSDDKAGSQSIERDRLEIIYDQHRSTRKVAQILGCHQLTVVRKLKKYGLTAKYK